MQDGHRQQQRRRHTKQKLAMEKVRVENMDDDDIICISDLIQISPVFYVHVPCFGNFLRKCVQEKRHDVKSSRNPKTELPRVEREGTKAFVCVCFSSKVINSAIKHMVFLRKADPAS